MEKFNVNSWFMSLPSGRQDILREDKWMLVEAVAEAAQEHQRKHPYGIDGGLRHDRISGKNGYVMAVSLEDGCYGYMEVYDGEDLTGEIIGVDLSCLDKA